MSKVKHTLWVFDVDGVLVDNTPRADLLPPIGQCATTQDWDEFNNAGHLDQPIAPMVDLFNRIARSPSNHVIVMTSRGYSSRWNTLMSLDTLGVHIGLRKKILMRVAGDNRPSGDVKRDMLRNYLSAVKMGIGTTYDEVVFVDDDPANIKAVEDLITLAIHVDGPCCARLRSNANAT